MKKMVDESGEKYCSRCLLKNSIPGVKILEDGECNFCKLHDEWDSIYGGSHGALMLNEILDMVRDEGKNKRYDCIVGISGGCDSSFLLDFLVEQDMKPLAVHWDNGWNTPTANGNIKKMIQGLGIDLYRIGVKKEEYNDLCRAFLFASTPDADIPNDIALTTALYLAADRFDCKYIMNAHSFRTEGTTPLGWTYMDGGYIKDVHEKLGSIPIPSYPNLEYESFKDFIMLGIERIRPLWFMDYDKKKAINYLAKEYDWKWYGQHHHENYYTIFVGAYLWPRKFNIDLRYIEYSALIRSGFITKELAALKVRRPPTIKPALYDHVLSTLKISRETMNRIMEAPPKSFRDYETYHERFKADEPFFKKALDRGLIPQTFYRKYVQGVNA
jgi:N-acetyl sugar amidotransferase